MFTFQEQYTFRRMSRMPGQESDMRLDEIYIKPRAGTELLDYKMKVQVNAQSSVQEKIVEGFFLGTPTLIEFLQGTNEHIQSKSATNKIKSKVLGDYAKTVDFYGLCHTGELAQVKELVQESELKRCSPLALNDQRQTPLHSAAIGRQLEVAKFLVEESNGCILPNYELFPKDLMLKTPVDYAVGSKNTELVNFLVSVAQAVTEYAINAAEKNKDACTDKERARESLQAAGNRLETLRSVVLSLTPVEDSKNVSESTVVSSLQDLESRFKILQPARSDTAVVPSSSPADRGAFRSHNSATPVEVATACALSKGAMERQVAGLPVTLSR